MKSLTSHQESLFKKAIIFAALVAIYVLLGIGGLKLATINANSSPIWPASGFAVGCLIIFGKRYAPAFFVGAFITNSFVDTPFLGLFFISTGNMLEAYVGASIVQLVVQKKSLKSYSELMAITFSGIIACIISASIGVSTLYYLGTVKPKLFSYTWYTWWSGDAIGILIFLPLLFELRHHKSLRFDISWEKIGLTILTGSFMVFITTLVFCNDYNQAFSWILPPFFIFTGIRIGRFASRILLSTLAMYIIFLTVNGHGPFEYGSQNLNLIYVQCLLCSYAYATLFVRPFKTHFAFSRKFVIGNLIGWTSIFVVIFMISDKDRDRMLKDLNRTIRLAIESINKTTQNYRTLIKNAEALVMVKPSLNLNDWEQFVNTAGLEENFDAIIGLGLVRPISKKNVNTYVEEIKKKGNKYFDLKLLDKEYSDKFQDHFITTFIAPVEKNKQALGLDIGSEVKRREAAWKAQGLRDAVATEPIELIQDKLKKKAFAILNPIWDQENHFLGWISAPIMSTIFFERSLSDFNHLLRIEIKSRNKKIFILDNFQANPKGNERYLIRKDISVFGLIFDIEFYPTDIIFSRNSASLPALALLMSLFMLFITSFLLEQIAFAQRAEDLVKERTKELDQSKMQLIQSSKMASLGEMASGMAHEINNPLTIIIGKISVIRVMLDDMKVNQPHLDEEIQKIKITTERIGKIVKGLRTFSRSSDNDPFEVVSLDKIVAETLDLCFERFKANGIDINIDKIPEVFVICRPGQISQVLLNLFNNTFDSIENLKEKWIHLSFKVKEQSILIYVTDSGKGIPPSVADKIMDPFYTTKDVKKGTGLGLSITKGIIESHGGQFWLDKSYPHTRFIIELKIEKKPYE